jgi:hypothetical protein
MTALIFSLLAAEICRPAFRSKSVSSASLNSDWPFADLTMPATIALHRFALLLVLAEFLGFRLAHIHMSLLMAFQFVGHGLRASSIAWAFSSRLVVRHELRRWLRTP